MKYAKITSSIWGTLEDTIISGHEGGEVMMWDMRKKTNESMLRIKPHGKKVMDLQRDKDGTCFVSASKDFTAKLFDIETLKELKVYRTEKPINSAAISPLKDHVLTGGGQEAVDAAVYSKSGKFEARFFHLVFEEEFGKVRDHFGPINSVAYHPDGRRYLKMKKYDFYLKKINYFNIFLFYFSYSSGGEDGFIRVHYFDKSYFDYDIKY